MSTQVKQTKILNIYMKSHDKTCETNIPICIWLNYLIFNIINTQCSHKVSIRGFCYCIIINNIYEIYFMKKYILLLIMAEMFLILWYQKNSQKEKKMSSTYNI